MNAGKNTMQVVRSVDRGERLAIPTHCPPDYAKLINECWDSDPSSRPPFTSILVTLERMRGEYFAKKVCFLLFFSLLINHFIFILMMMNRLWRQVKPRQPQLPLLPALQIMIIMERMITLKPRPLSPLLVMMCPWKPLLFLPRLLLSFLNSLLPLLLSLPLSALKDPHPWPSPPRI